MNLPALVLFALLCSLLTANIHSCLCKFAKCKRAAPFDWGQSNAFLRRAAGDTNIWWLYFLWYWGQTIFQDKKLQKGCLSLSCDFLSRWYRTWACLSVTYLKRFLLSSLLGSIHTFRRCSRPYCFTGVVTSAVLFLSSDDKRGHTLWMTATFWPFLTPSPHVVYIEVKCQLPWTQKRRPLSLQKTFWEL